MPTDAELNAALEGLRSVGAIEPEPPPPEPEPEPEPPPPPVAAEPPASAPEPEPPAPEPTPDPDPGDTVEAVDKELLAEKLKHAEEEAKRFESIAGRHAGELGFLKTKLQEVEARLSAAPPSDGGYEPPAVPEPIPPGQGRDKLLSYIVAQAIPQAVASFESRYPDAATLADGMGKYLRDNGVNLQALTQSDDPLFVSREVDRHLTSAYDYAKSAQRAEKIRSLETKRAEMFARIKEAKTSASPPVPASPPAPEPPPKAFADLSQAEMLKEIGKLVRG